MTLVAGVDSSTQSTKVVLRDLDTGDFVAQAASPHPATSPPTSEQDPQAWWAALSSAFAKLEGYRHDVAALSVAGQQHGLVLIDDAGSSIRPAKLWNDTTSSHEASQLLEAHGGTFWVERCGSVPVASFSITKLAWLLNHEARHADAVAKIMLPHDYLTWRLTDQHVTDRGDASGTGWFDPATGTYSDELLGVVTGDSVSEWRDRLPRVLAHDEPAGELTPAAAAALALRPGIPVGPGTGDNMAAALGLGLQPGDTVISLGTSGTVYTTSLTPSMDPTGTVAGFADATGNYLPLVCTLNATKVTDTVASWLNTTPEGLSTLALEATPRDHASPPTLVPYLDGERTPNIPHASGTWFGLRTDTTRAELARAAFDGVLCGLLEGHDALHKVGGPARGRTFLIGGGARSSAYRQRAADLLGAPITIPDDDELVATGAASQAAAILTSTTPTEVAASWDLGDGTVVQPSDPHGDAIGRSYRTSAATIRSHYLD